MCPPAATRRVFFKFQAAFLKIPTLVQFWLLALGDISSLHYTLQSFPAWCPAHASSPSPLTPAPGLPHDTGSVSVRSTVGHTEARERQACAEGAGQKWQSWAWEAGSGCPIWSTNPSAPLTTGRGVRWGPGSWEGGPPPSPRRATAPFSALSGLQHREARLQGAWKRDRGCLFSCLSRRLLPDWGLVFLELKHTALSPHWAVSFSKQDFSVGDFRGKPLSGGLQASPSAAPLETGGPGRLPSSVLSVSGKAPVYRKQVAPSVWVV